MVNGLRFIVIDETGIPEMRLQFQDESGTWSDVEVVKRDSVDKDLICHWPNEICFSQNVFSLVIAEWKRLEPKRILSDDEVRAIINRVAPTEK